QRGVWLLGRDRADLQAHAALLRTAFKIAGLGFGLGRAPRAANKLVQRGHKDTRSGHIPALHNWRVMRVEDCSRIAPYQQLGKTLNSQGLRGVWGGFCGRFPGRVTGCGRVAGGLDPSIFATVSATWPWYFCVRSSRRTMRLRCSIACKAVNVTDLASMSRP